VKEEFVLREAWYALRTIGKERTEIKVRLDLVLLKDSPLTPSQLFFSLQVPSHF
jgi:hypothetical protein